MTDTTPAGGPTEVADRLIGAMDNLTTEFQAFKTESETDRDTLRRYGKRNRWIIVADLTATITFAVASILFVQARQSADTASRKSDRVALIAQANHAAGVAQCEAGNDYRAKDLARWQNLLALSPPPQTDAAKTQLAKITDINNQADAMRDCTAVK